MTTVAEAAAILAAAPHQATWSTDAERGCFVVETVYFNEDGSEGARIKRVYLDDHPPVLPEETAPPAPASGADVSVGLTGVSAAGEAANLG